MRKLVAMSSVIAVSAVAVAGAVYTYENDGKTYVATVSDAETVMSDEAIAVLNANEVTNFVVRGTHPLVVKKGSTFTGDVILENNVRLAADGALGVGPGVIRGEIKKITLQSAIVRKKVELDCAGSWSENTGIVCWAGDSTFKEKVSFTYGNFGIYPYVNGTIRFEGGFEGTGYLVMRSGNGGNIVFENEPLSVPYAIQIIAPENFHNSGYSYHIDFSVPGNTFPALGHENQGNPYFITDTRLRTTVDWAFNSSSQILRFGPNSLWDLCGTAQKIGELVATYNKESTDEITVITNSSLNGAKLQFTQTSDSTLDVLFGGNLSVDISGSKKTTIDHAMTASGEISVNQGELAFTGNGSWKNASNVFVANGAKVSISAPDTFGRDTDVCLSGNGAFVIAAGEGGSVVTQMVRQLVVDGVSKAKGFYVMGAGVLEVRYSGCRDLSDGVFVLGAGESFTLGGDVLCDKFDRIELGAGAKLEILTREFFKDNAEFELHLGEGSELTLADGIGIYAVSVDLGGKRLPPGRYTASNATWLNGEGVVFVPYGKIAGSEVRWTAGGADTLMTTEENWSDPVDLSNGSVYAMFSQGAGATVVGNPFLNGVDLDTAGTFEIGANDADSVLHLASGGIKTVGDGVYLISAPICVDGDQTWQVGKELTVAGAVDSDALAKYSVHKKGSGGLVLSADSNFAGDLYLDEGGIRLERGMTFGNGAGKVVVGPQKDFTLHHATLDKDIFYNNSDSGWNDHKLSIWEGASAINGKLAFGNRNLDIFFWKGSDLVIKGGIEDADHDNAGYFRLRAGAGSITIEGKPIKVKNGIAVRPEGFDSKGSAGTITIATTGNEISRIGRDNGTENLRPNCCTLRTTVDWAFDNAGMIMMLGYDSVWDLCGTVQRVGHLDTKVVAGHTPTVVTNSSEKTAKLYVTQTADTTPWIDFAGKLSVDFSGTKTTTINCAMTATGDLTVNAGKLTFVDGGSWRGAENIEVNGAAKISIGHSGVFHRTASMSLASETSLEIASGVSMRVVSLNVGGVQMPVGDYVFGGGTLSVGPVGMRVIVR